MCYGVPQEIREKLLDPCPVAIDHVDSGDPVLNVEPWVSVLQLRDHVVERVTEIRDRFDIHTQARAQSAASEIHHVVNQFSHTGGHRPKSVTQLHRVWRLLFLDEHFSNRADR